MAINKKTIKERLMGRIYHITFMGCNPEFVIMGINTYQKLKNEIHREEGFGEIKTICGMKLYIIDISSPVNRLLDEDGIFITNQNNLEILKLHLFLIS